MFSFYFYPWPYILSVKTSFRNNANIFNIAVPVFPNLF